MLLKSDNLFTGKSCDNSRIILQMLSENKPHLTERRFCRVTGVKKKTRRCHSKRLDRVYFLTNHSMDGHIQPPVFQSSSVTNMSILAVGTLHVRNLDLVGSSVRKGLKSSIKQREAQKPKTCHFFGLTYSSNEIRKKQNEHLNIIRQHMNTQ